LLLQDIAPRLNQLLVLKQSLALSVERAQDLERTGFGMPFLVVNKPTDFLLNRKWTSDLVEFSYIR
jgi:hypothetical protein